jgi:rhamnosyl/mannosyltransferase
MRQIYRSVLQRFLGRLDRIIVSSPNMAALPLLQPYARRIAVIPFGCDVGLLQSPPALPDGLLPARNGRPVVLFAGRLVAYKGVDVLLRALPGLEVSTWILGDGPERLRLERLAHRLGLQDRVQFLGYRPRDQLRAAMHRASLLVFPSVSRAEAFGVVQIEAMASGLPVINTFLPTGVNFVSPHGVTGWTVPPDDPAALRAALHALLQDHTLRQHFAREARLRAAHLFDLRLQTRRLHELYQDVLAGCS